MTKQQKKSHKKKHNNNKRAYNAQVDAKKFAKQNIYSAQDKSTNKNVSVPSNHIKENVASAPSASTKSAVTCTPCTNVQTQLSASELDSIKWDCVLDSKHRLLDFNLKEIYQYRDLIWSFIKRDFTTAYKQTVLGPIWYIVTPLVTTVINTFVFGNLAQIGTDGVPYLLFYYAGTMLWTYFTNCLSSAADIFKNNQAVFSKVYFPRLTVAISNMANSAIKMLIQFACLLVFYIYYLIIGSSITPTFGILLFPLLIGWLGILGTGIGMIFSALTTKYRDLAHILGFITGLAMYVTPVVYPLSEAPSKFAWIFYINPASAPIELFRIWFYSAGFVPPLMILISLFSTALFLFIGLILFSRNERTFVDVI